MNGIEYNSITMCYIMIYNMIEREYNYMLKKYYWIELVL